jgi:hypothetical protein
MPRRVELYRLVEYSDGVWDKEPKPVFSGSPDQVRSYAATFPRGTFEAEEIRSLKKGRVHKRVRFELE